MSCARFFTAWALVAVLGAAGIWAALSTANTRIAADDLDRQEQIAQARYAEASR